MRDIKFRAYNPRDKKMHYDITGFEFLVDGNMSGVFIDGVFFLIEEVEIMQYTGLKDRNQVEIYEGDIVELKANNGCCEMIGIIIYDEYDLAFELRDIGEGTQECLWYAEQELEVIGNIYDNPDLLEKGAEE